MKIDKPLIHGTLVKRYKRFLADIELDDGTVVTAHCTNSGSMKSCLESGAEVYMSESDNPKRKTKFSWEMILINDSWVGINTAVPNSFAYWAINNNLIDGIGPFAELKREQTINDSRIDVCGTYADGRKCYIEVKNVTLKSGNYVQFPDAVTTRGQKHLKTLMDCIDLGHDAVMLYIIQRTDVSVFTAAKGIDPEYARLLSKAVDHGVRIIPLQIAVSPQEYTIQKVLPFEL